MADNTVIPPGSGGDTVRTIDRVTAKTQVNNLDFGGEAGPESLVTLSNPLPIQPAATYFAFSSGNSTTAQLAGGATFTGTIESILAQPQISLLIITDQPLLIQLQQFITATDPFPAEEQDYVISAGSAATGGGFSLALNANGNYFRAIITNAGQSATTQLNVNTYYGTIAPTLQRIATFNQMTGQLDPAEAGDNSRDFDAPSFKNPTGLLSSEAYPRMFDGGNWHMLRGSLDGGLLVDMRPVMELLGNMLIEMRVHNSLLRSGMISFDDLDQLRKEEAFNLPKGQQ